MNVFLVLTVAIGVVAADVSSLGYQYSSPQSSYGIPSQISASSSNYNTRYASAGNGGNGFGFKGLSGGVVSYPAGSIGTVYQSNGYQSGGSGSGYQGASLGSGYQGGSAGLGYQGNSGSGYQGVGISYQGLSGGSGNQGASGGAGYQGSSGGAGYQGLGTSYQGASIGSGYQGGSSGSGFQGGSTGFGGSSFSQKQYQQQIQFQQQPAQVFKHFYVHAAPEEPETARPRGPVVLPPAQKHYKIIFIKTPAQAAGGAAIAPVVPQNEEKTIVYVLVKKPEDLQDVVVPKIEQKPPSKPEVYFIKYKNKEDSQAVINNIVSDYNKGQQSVSFSGLGAEAGGLSVGGSGGSGAAGSGFSSGGSGFSSGGSGFSSGNSGYSESAGLSGNSGFSGSSGLSGGSGYSGSSGLSGGSGLSVLSDTGSYSGGFDSGAAGSSGSFAVQSSSESYSQGGGSLGGVTISRSEPISQAVTTGYESSDLSSGVGQGFIGASSTANYDVSSVSSQGVPHETYGIPTFKTQ